MRLSLIGLLAIACAPDSSAELQTPEDSATSAAPLVCQWQYTDAGVSNECAGLPGAPSSVGAPVQLSVLPGGLLQIANLTYATRGGYVLQGDLVVPPLDAGTPGILVVVHGGGWQDCGRRRVSPDVVSYAQSMAALYKVATFSIEYRLRQEGGAYPENLKDVKCALEWMSGLAPYLGLDGTRLGVAGESAGAHLALMSAVTHGRADLDPGCGPAVRPSLVLEYSGPANLPSLMSTPVSGAIVPYAGPCPLSVDPLACSASKACTRCQDASPTQHACTAAPTTFGIIHGPTGYDLLVPTTQATSLYSAFASAGVDARLLIPTVAEITAAGCDTSWLGQAHGWNRACLQRATGAAVFAPIQAALGRR